MKLARQVEELEARDMEMNLLKKQRESAQIQLEALQKEAEQLRSQLSQLERSAKLVGDEKLQLQELNSQLEKSLATSQESFKALETNLNSSKTSVDSCRDSLHSKVVSFEATIQSLRNQLNEHGDSLRAVREQLKQCQLRTALTDPTSDANDSPPLPIIEQSELPSKEVGMAANAPRTVADNVAQNEEVGVGGEDAAGVAVDRASYTPPKSTLTFDSPTADILAEYKTDTSPEARRHWIKREFLHSWEGYKNFAWGQDELKPVSRTPHENFGMGLTLVDSLDTIIIMGLDKEYEECLEWIRDDLTFGHQVDINLFETTIRIMGSLLASYHLKGEQIFLDKAKQLADQMIYAFDSPTGIPYGTLNLQTRTKFNPGWSGGASTVAEVGSIQMEWQYLSRLTNNPIYEQKVDLVITRLKDLNRALYGMFISPDKGHMTSTVITFGARVDSLYEYFLKQHLLSGQQKPVALKLYLDSMQAMISQLLVKSTPSGYTFVSELHDDKNVGKMDHLVCFVPGMLALGANASVVDEPMRTHHMTFAKELMRTCYEFYRQTPTGLAPEIILFNNEPNVDFIVDPHAHHNLLRPETVESLFVLWRTTRDPIYRQWGWEIFEAFVRYCRIPGEVTVD